MWRHNGGLFAKCLDDKVEAKPGEVQDLTKNPAYSTLLVWGRLVCSSVWAHIAFVRRMVFLAEVLEVAPI
jgi:3'-phosphoadenosine 5'-phosphosulfate sulfotransferase